MHRPRRYSEGYNQLPRFDPLLFGGGIGNHMPMFEGRARRRYERQPFGGRGGGHYSDDDSSLDSMDSVFDDDLYPWESPRGRRYSLDDNYWTGRKGMRRGRQMYVPLSPLP